MTIKKNGSGHNGNGITPPENSDGEEASVIKFPTLAERDRLRREKLAEEERYRRQYRNEQKAVREPFFNAGKIPPLTRAIVIAFLLVQLPLYLLVSAPERYDIFYTFGFVPARFTGGEAFLWSTPLTPLTHLFLHGSWMHFLFNTIMTLALCTFFEKQYGAPRMAVFLAFCSLTSAALHFVLSPFSNIPVIGASGAISGLFGVVLLTLYEHGQMGGAGKYGIYPLLVFWGVLIVAGGFITGESIAWQAHLGGYLGGLALHFALRKKRY